VMRGSYGQPMGWDSMSPAKVELSSFAPPGITNILGKPNFKQPASPNFASSFSSGEWAAIVHGVAPCLNAQGLRRALAILDQATQNVQRLKALDEVIRSTHEAEAMSNTGFAPLPYAQCAVTCMALQEQVRDQQLHLLVELQQLPLDAKAVRKELYETIVPPPAPPPMFPPELLAHFPSLALLGLGQGESVPEVPNRLGTAPAPGMEMRLPATAHPPAMQTAMHGLPPHATSWQGSPKAQPAVGPAARPNARKMQTLSSSLQMLSDEDPDCLFIVRRINKLGFKAARVLKRYFTTQGQVLKVLLAHSTVKQYGAPQSHARRRPSSLGFVQMATAEGAQKVLALGDEQDVDGVIIRVQRFERQRYAEAMAEEEAEAECESDGGHEKYDKLDEAFQRQISEASTYSGVTCISNHTADSGPDEEA